MNPMNFATYTRRDVRESNYRLLDERPKLTAKITKVFDAPGVDAWEGEGGAVMPLPVEEEVSYKSKSVMNVRGARKQRAAKQFIPRESIKVVKIGRPVDVKVAMAVVTGKSDDEIKIVSLEAQIERLLGIVQAPRIAAERKAASLKKLEEVFESKRTKV